MKHRDNLKYKLLAACAASALMLAGCGGDKEGGEVDAPASSATQRAASDDIMGGKSPIEEEFRFSGGEPLDVDAFFAAMADEDEPSDVQYASSSFDSDIGATVIEQFTSTDDDSVTTVGRIELYGVNEAQIQALKDSDGTAPKDEIFRKVRMFDVSIVNTGGESEGGAVTIGALEFDRLSLGGFPEEDMDVSEGEEEDGGDFAAVMKGIEFGGLYMTDLNVAGMENEGTGIDANVADLRFGGFGGGEFGPIYLEGLDYTVRQSQEAKQALIDGADPQAAAILAGPLGNIIMPAEQRARIELMTWDGMSFAGLLPYLESGEQPPLTATNLLSFGKIEAKNAVSWVNGKEAATTEYSVVEPVEFAWLIPTRIRSYSEGTTMDMTAYVPEEETEMMALFRDNGLDDLSGESEFLWTYDDQGGDASLSIDSDMTGFADFDIGLDLSNAVLADLHAATQSEDPSAMLAIALNGFTLRIADEKLLDTVFGIAGMQMGQDPAQLRASAPLMINMGGAQFAQMNPAFPQYLQAVSDWVSLGGTLEIKMAPSAPIPFATVATTGQTAPQTLPDVLNLSVEQSGGAAPSE